MTLGSVLRRQQRALLLGFALLAAAGAYVGLRLPVSLFPPIDFPRLVVSIDSGDQPADAMEITVTRPAELAVRSARHLVGVRSTTSRGSAELSINFDWGSDMQGALLQTQAALAELLPRLPAGTRFEVRRMDPTVFPMLAYSLTGPDGSAVALRDLADYTLAPLLSAIPGVARVGVQGGAIAECRVDVDPGRLRGYGLGFDTLAQALTAGNALRAVGRIEDRSTLYLALADSRVTACDQLARVVVRGGNGGLLRLDQLARIAPGVQPQWQRVTADGRDAVLVQVYQQPGANALVLAQAARTQLKAFAPRVPPGVKLATWYDQSELVGAAAGSVRDAILIGTLLAGLVLLAFLRSWHLTLVAALVVPAVLLTTCLLLYLFGQTLNIMSLGAMAAAVGLIVDDVIVMLEHLVRRARQAPAADQFAAAAEFTRPLAGSSAATLVVFAPLALLSGVTGGFFKALALTMAASLAVSFLAAWLIVPLLTARLLRDADLARDDAGPLLSRVQAGYRALLTRLLRQPVLVLVGVLPLLALGLIGYRQLGSGFMPHMDEGGFVLDYVAAPGTSLTETSRLLAQVETLLRADPAVATYSGRTGLQLGGGLTEANQGDFFVRLKALPRDPIDAVMDRLRQRIETAVPGLQIEMMLLMEDVIGDLTAVPQPIEVKLLGEDAGLLRRTAPQVARAIAAVPGIVDLKDGIVLAGDALTVVVDREQAAIEGLDPDRVASAARTWIDGLLVTALQQPYKDVGVRLGVPAALRAHVDDIEQLPLQAADGHWLALKRVARLRTDVGQAQISRDNGQRMVAVTARLAGRDLGSAAAEVQRVLARPGLLPTGVRAQLGGLYAQQRAAFRDLTAVFGAALALSLLLLTVLFRRLRTAVAVLLLPLLASAAVFAGLWLTGSELDISALMGLTMIIGIVTEVAIFYLTEVDAQRAEGTPAADIPVQAGVSRLRPIAMTTLAAMLALAPLALGLGAGSAMLQPLAIAIEAGLAVQLPLVLLVLPVLLAATQRTAPATPFRASRDV